MSEHEGAVAPIVTGVRGFGLETFFGRLVSVAKACSLWFLREELCSTADDGEWATRCQQRHGNAVEAARAQAAEGVLASLPILDLATHELRPRLVGDLDRLVVFRPCGEHRDPSLRAECELRASLTGYATARFFELEKVAR